MYIYICIYRYIYIHTYISYVFCWIRLFKLDSCTMVFTKVKIMLILSATKKQASYVFPPGLEIYMLMVSTLAFVLFKDLEPLFFHDQITFPQDKIFSSSKKVFHKQTFFLVQINFFTSQDFCIHTIIKILNKNILILECLVVTKGHIYLHKQ